MAWLWNAIQNSVKSAQQLKKDGTPDWSVLPPLTRASLTLLSDLQVAVARGLLVRD
jgi:hypothetical protein